MDIRVNITITIAIETGTHHIQELLQHSAIGIINNGHLAFIIDKPTRLLVCEDKAAEDTNIGNAS